MNLNSIDVELLISLVENRPIIWDNTIENYRERNIRAAAWREVAVSLNDEFDHMDEVDRQAYVKIIVKKWNQLRDSLIRSLHEQKRLTRRPAKKYIYHERLSFLLRVLNPTIFENDENSEDIKIEAVRIDNSDNDDAEYEPSSHTEETVSDERELLICRKKRKSQNLSNVELTRKKRGKLDRMRSSQDVANISMNSSVGDEDRHMSFFKSLIPSLAMFDDDQTLEFQSGVIKLVRDIKRGSYYIE